MDLIKVLPDTPQKEAVLHRARRLTDFTWTPVGDVPAYIRNVGNIVLPAGEALTGFPYSSTELNDNFFMENVSVETFLSAIPNPYSKLYQPGTGAFNSCCYGIVCNGLVRYAMGIDYRISTFRWYTIDGMRCIAEKDQYSANDLQLCDMLLRVHEKGKSNHIVLITGLWKDAQGNVVRIEVSEAKRPICVRRQFDVEAFFETFPCYSLVRYDHLDSVPLPDEETDRLLENNPYTDAPKIGVDNGNKANYLEGETTVVSVNAADKDVVQVVKDGVLIEEIPVVGKAVFPREFSVGYYVLSLKNEKAAVEFAVNKANISFTVQNKTITVKADPCDPSAEIVYMDFRELGKDVSGLAKYEILTAEEKTSGIITRCVPENAENFKIYFKNKYGIWAHRMINMYIA
ncbi:MAG: hypothetical protein IKU07_06260 [Oscillospiraceae bacterium]|nr:hypothetical protein [Oscillospiraceae bacterium]